MAETLAMVAEARRRFLGRAGALGGLAVASSRTCLAAAWPVE